MLDQESHVLSERLEHRRHVRERRPGVVGEASLAQQGLSPSENLTLSPDAGGRRRLNPRPTSTFMIGAALAKSSGARSYNFSHIEEDLEAARRGPAPSRPAHGARASPPRSREVFRPSIRPFDVSAIEFADLPLFGGVP